MDIRNTYHSAANYDVQTLKVRENPHDNNSPNYLRTIQNSTQFNPNDILFFNDTYSDIEPKQLSFVKNVEGMLELDFVTSNIVDVGSMFLELRGDMTFLNSLFFNLTHENQSEIYRPLERPPKDFLGSMISLATIPENIDVIAAIGQQPITKGEYGLIPAYFQTKCIKSFKTRLGNNLQLIESWDMVAQNAMNNLVTVSERDKVLFGELNRESGHQPPPQQLKQMVNLMRHVADQQNVVNKALTFPYVIYVPLRLVSTLFNTTTDNLFWPTGVPVNFVIDTEEQVIFHNGQMKLQGAAQPLNEEGPYKFDLTQLGSNTQQIKFKPTSVQLCYNEHIPKVAVKEILNLKLLKEPRLYRYNIPQHYIKPLNENSLIYTQTIQLNSTILTEIILFSAKDNTPPYYTDLTLKNMSFNYNGYIQNVLFTDESTTPEMRANIGHFQFPRLPEPTLLRSVKICGNKNFKLSLMDSADYMTSASVAQQNIETSNVYNEQTVTITNPTLGRAKYHRLVISPLKSLDCDYINSSYDNRTITLEIEIMYNTPPHYFQNDAAGANEVISTLSYLHVVVPTPAQYEIDLARNVYIHKYPSLMTDMNYKHTNISQISAN
jgi:hypothetical protein